MAKKKLKEEITVETVSTEIENTEKTVLEPVTENTEQPNSPVVVEFVNSEFKTIVKEPIIMPESSVAESTLVFVTLLKTDLPVLNEVAGEITKLWKKSRDTKERERLSKLADILSRILNQC